ncbi:MAG: hypothetical protein IPH12_16820 [Saprospirales bacterium]|nr:hypothetical protein [Saprospirales bacterium]
MMKYSLNIFASLLALSLLMSVPFRGLGQQAPNTLDTTTINNNPPTATETNKYIIEIGQERSASFGSTFFKFPFVAFSLAATYITCILAGICEFFINIFTLFNHGFPIVKEIYKMGWNTITVNWWWKPGVGWHIGVTIVIFMGIANNRRR